MDFDKAAMDNKLTINRQEFTFGEIVSVDETNLSEEFATQAGRMAYIGAELAEAEHQYGKAKASREEMYSIIYLELKEDYAKAAKKVTEAALKSEIEVDDEYINAIGLELQAKRNFSLLKNFHTALRQRGEMLISLGAQRRQEYDMTNMKIREAKDKLRG